MASSQNVVDLSALPAGAAKFDLLKRQVESDLEKKVPSALTVRERPAPVTLPTGVAAVDALTGGVPRGALSEITGPVSSGRTSLLLSLLAQATARAEFCALVDASGAFDPASAEHAGVDLERVLWVRCTRLPNCRTAELQDSQFGNSALRHFGNRKDLSTLDKVLRVADLLLSGGGFGLVALDLGDVPADAACRVPLTTWFRFRRAVEGTPAALVVLEQEAHAKSCADLVLRLQASDFRRQRPALSAQPSTELPSHAQIFCGLEVAVELVRGHAQKKVVASSKPAQFSTTAAWAV